MKILYIPLNTAIKEEDDFYLSLSKLHDVVWFWKNASVSKNKIDICHFQSGAIEPHLVRNIKKHWPNTLITQWTGDYRPEPMEMVTQYKGLVDITFMAADVPYLYPDMNVKWLPHWVGDWQFREVNPNAEGVVMIANNYPQFPGGKEREELHNFLRQRKDYVCYGSGFEGSQGNVPYRKTPDIYNKFRFAVGGNIYNDAPKYFSNRPLAAMAAGGCFLWRDVKGFDYPGCRYFENGQAIYFIENLEFKKEYIIQNQQWLKENFHSDVIVKKYLYEVQSQFGI